jgi:hypothetical protein
MHQKPVMKEEIDKVRDHMMRYHCGYRRAFPRQQIAPVLRMEDRHFRDVCAEIPEIITSIHSGYWILPLVDASGEEARVAKSVLENEDRRRIIALYLRMRRQREAINTLRLKHTQTELAFS